MSKAPHTHTHTHTQSTVSIQATNLLIIYTNIITVNDFKFVRKIFSDCKQHYSKHSVSN
jgi:hypothetical protein